MKTLMKYIASLFLLIFLFSCSSSKKITTKNYEQEKFIEQGIASWYGPNFDGKKTANGEIYDMNKLTAAHRTLPFNSLVKVVSKTNNKSVVVRINDRGPYAKNRIIDLSKKAAAKIDLITNGTAKVDLFLLSKTKVPKNLKVPLYSVQVGSYKNKNDAMRISSKIIDSRVVKVKLDNKIFYRIYVGLFNNKNEAVQLKGMLKAKGIDGFVKQTGI